MELYEYARPGLMAGKKILYVHGFASSGQNGSVRTLRLLMPRAQVLAPDLPVEPFDAMELLRNMVVSEKPDLIVGSSMGAIIFGGLQGVFLLPLFSSQALIPIRLPSPNPVFPDEESYTSINLDLNLPGMCGLGKHIPNISTALSRMIFSNIFSQCQVILGQANAATLGPSVSVAPHIKSGNGISGPKAWDLVLPILLGVGLEVQTLEHKKISTMTPKYCLDSFVLRDRIIIAHKETIDAYCSDLKNLCSI